MSELIQALFSLNTPLRAKDLQLQLTKVLREEIRLPPNEIRPISLMLLEDILQIDRVQLLTDGLLTDISKEKIQLLKEALERLSRQEPIQYITEKAVFGAFTLKVNQNVLIPRPETEELVEKIIQQHTKMDFRRIIDLGTGSACIALALAQHFKNAEVWAVDLSEKALEVAQHNIEKYQAAIHLLKADMLQLPAEQFPTFSLIVSNPPYVKVSEQKYMQPNVLDYEPSLALFVDDNEPLRYYQAIANFAQQHLEKEGSLWLEINEQYGKEVVHLLASYGFHSVHLHQDLHQKNRFVSARQ